MNHNQNPQETAQMDRISDWDILTEGNHQPETPGAPEALDQAAILHSELFSPERQRAVLDSIAAPTDAPDGINRVMDSLRSKHELRILARMGRAGFDNWDRLTPDTLRTFVADFPSPDDFEGFDADFLADIEKYNGPEKRAQYDRAMASFKHKVYGEKQAYYEQMKAINALRGQVPLAVAGAQSPEQHQVERSAEWEPGSAGVSQVSRAQVRQGLDPEWPNGFESDQSCQDAFLAREEDGVFGVFDGVGGSVGGRVASHAAAQSINQSCDKYNLKYASDLAYIVNQANQFVRDATGGEGQTTATLAKVVDREGQKILAYASVGDTRLYLVHPGGEAQLITRDEGEGNVITNALGVVGGNRARQYGEVPVASGDKVVLCSDGVTGDFDPDLMSEAEIGDIVNHSPTPSEAASRLIASARKTDDRTAVVFAI